LQVNFELIDSHAINGNIEEISFIGGRIGVINPFGFTTLKDRAIILKMENVLVKKIEPQAFKKFAVEQMEITNCVFEQNVPSKAFYELEILNSLHIHNVKFREVHTRAFSFKMISKLIITNNYFEAVDGEWIEAYVRDNVIVRENYFGRTSVIAFKGIRVHRDYMSSESLELRLANNTIISPYEQPRALEFTEAFAVNIKQLRYENEFDCKDLDITQKPPKPRNQFFLSNIDNIFFYKMGFNTSHDANNYNQSFVVLGKIIEKDCQQRSYLLYKVLGIVGSVLLLLIIAISVWIYFVKKRRRRKLDVVIPEPRTYKETQIVYQIENAGLLKTDL
ncbi:uncharacterized protein LOC119664995, partial [Teleopsis dalmanni]|uniref:uncharacterized protein LOC119664995 n=1 Tax=Teleopsis dalmanni TaxID=139649 RepID=UPI0018CE49DF